MSNTPASQGLTSVEASRLLAQWGPNILETKRPGIFTHLWKLLYSPMSLMFIAAAGLSVLGGHTEDAIIILALFAVNIGVSLWQEAKADRALERLQQKLAVTSQVLRDGQWQSVSATKLVPGDFIKLSSGNTVPADIEFVSTNNFSLNQAALTGESLPVEKKTGDTAYAGAFVAVGLAEARVTKTGPRTYMASTISQAAGARPRSSLERDIYAVSKFLSLASITATMVLGIALWWAHLPPLEIATLGVSMLIAGIPVALPTVMTLIISVGVVGLASRAVVVRRLSSLEDLADVTLLLSDKTGTLTQNRIVVEQVRIIAEGYPEDALWPLAAAVAGTNVEYPTNKAVYDTARSKAGLPPEVTHFIPGDSERKRTTAFVELAGAEHALSLGAPQAVAALCAMTSQERERFNAAVSEAGRNGQRALVLAEGAHGKEVEMKMLAVFSLADALRPDAKDTISFLQKSGVTVKMVTGDSFDIAAHVSHTLGLEGDVLKREDFTQDGDALKQRFVHAAAFAEVLPKDKYDLVTLARTLPAYKVVAVTGDGVNDVPAVTAANVGLAVPGAVDALRGNADIVLTEGGIAVIREAIVEARKIFVRLYNYSVYRISESFRLIVTIAVIGILFGAYPLSPVMIILIALLNDIPIVSLALDRVAVPERPTSINVRARLKQSLLFGATGVGNSLALLVLALYILHVPWEVFQTMFFLKLTVSGHMLVYVAHTHKRWWRFLPAGAVIAATSITQLIATGLALGGVLVAPISLSMVALVWVWSFGWMQVAEFTKPRIAT